MENTQPPQKNTNSLINYLLYYVLVVGLLFIMGFFPSFNFYGSTIYIINPLIQAQLKIIAVSLTFFGTEFIIFYAYYKLIKSIIIFYDDVLNTTKTIKNKIEKTLLNVFKGGS